MTTKRPWQDRLAGYGAALLAAALVLAARMGWLLVRR